MIERLDSIRVDLGGRLVDAMWALERGGANIALVVDTDGRLQGTLTDGDVRRALLAGAPLDSALEPHVCRAFTAVPRHAGRAEVLDLMKARMIGQVPVVDDAGRLLALHLLHELIGRVERPNWAVVFAGGQGLRLRPLTADRPKPMITVAGRPILERIVLHLVGQGIRRIFLAIHYLGKMIEDHFGDGSRFGCRIDYLREETPLGTAGALSLLPELAPHPIVVMNGDLITEVAIGTMLEAHAAEGAMATVGVRRYFHTVPFGCVDVDGNRITHIVEKPRISQLANAGIYVLAPELPARLVKNEAINAPTIIEQCLTRRERVVAFEIESDWIDVGQKDQLREARGGEP